MNKILELNPEHFSSVLAVPLRFLQFIITVYNKFFDDAGFARAGNLAYSTLMAAVPFAALILSLVSAFGGLKSVQNQLTDFIVQLLVPTRQAEIKAILDQFINNTNKLGVIGLVFFTITSVMLLNTINVNLNAVWGSRMKTNFLNKFTTYTSVIIFGTLLLAASTTLSSRFSFITFDNIAILNRILLRIAPFVFDFLVIMLLNGITPSGRVQIKYLAITSAVGAVFWELLKYAVFTVSGYALRISVIYGTIALVPIFLFWIYIIWTIVLFCMETAWVLQHNKSAWQGKAVTDMNPSEKMAFGFELFMFIAEEFDNGRPGPNSDNLSVKFSVSLSDINTMTSILSNSNLLTAVGADYTSWVPARSLSKIKTIDLINAIFGRAEQEEIIKFYKNGSADFEDVHISDYLTPEKR